MTKIAQSTQHAHTTGELEVCTKQVNDAKACLTQLHKVVNAAISKLETLVKEDEKQRKKEESEKEEKGKAQANAAKEQKHQ